MEVACHRRGIQPSWLAYKTLPSSSEQHTLHMLLLMTLLRQYRELFLRLSLSSSQGRLRGVSRTIHGKTFQRKRLWSSVVCKNLGHLAVAEVGGADLGAATMMLVAVLRSPPELSRAGQSSNLLTRLMAERFLFNKEDPISGLAKFSVPLLILVKSASRIIRPSSVHSQSSTPLIVIVATQDPSHCGNFSEITDS